MRTVSNRRSKPFSALSGLAVLAFCSLLAGCGGFVIDKTVDGSWHLVAVDVREDAILCFRSENICNGDGLPESTVFAAGADQSWVVLARHPGAEKTITEYYYFRRPPELPYRGAGEVIGPLTHDEFNTAASRLGLPLFSVVIEDLR